MHQVESANGRRGRVQIHVFGERGEQGLVVQRRGLTPSPSAAPSIPCAVADAAGRKQLVVRWAEHVVAVRGRRRGRCGRAVLQRPQVVLGVARPGVSLGRRRGRRAARGRAPERAAGSESPCAQRAAPEGPSGGTAPEGTERRSQTGTS